jgi:hypothetical protein
LSSDEQGQSEKGQREWGQDLKVEILTEIRSLCYPFFSVSETLQMFPSVFFHHCKEHYPVLANL